VLESAEFSVVSNLLLTRERAELAGSSRFTDLLGDFLADSSNFGTMAKFAVTPEVAQNIGISASGFSEERGTLEMGAYAHQIMGVGPAKAARSPSFNMAKV
jgi:hypothetical protein